MVQPHALLPVLVVLGTLTGEACGWVRGDTVPMMHRQTYKGDESSWRELPSNLAPKFGRNLKVKLHSLVKMQAAEGNYKLSFSVGHDLGWITPWIMVEYGECKESIPHKPCHHLTHIKFTFTYEKNVFGKVTGFRWQPTYSDTPNDYIHLHYIWAEEPDHDLNTALYFLYSFAVFASLFLVVMIGATPGMGPGGASVRAVPMSRDKAY